MLELTLDKNTYSICRLPSCSDIPDWVDFNEGIVSCTHTKNELSIVCPWDHVPPEIQQNQNWKAIKVQGPLDFNDCGILNSIITPLAENKISIFTISTYDTDYVFVRENDIERATQILEKSFIVKK